MSNRARWIWIFSNSSVGIPVCNVLFDYTIDNTILDGLLTIHEKVALGVALDRLHVLAGVIGQQHI